MTNGYARLPVLQRTSILVLFALLASCATTRITTLPELPSLENQPAIEIPDVKLLSISPGMKEFVNQYGYDRHNFGNRAWVLVYAAMNPFVLNFEYDPQVTLPAAETFEASKGNCLSFSSMFVAMAREANLTAYFQEVAVPPQWSNVNDNMLVSKHVNAVVLNKGRKFTVDVSRRKTTTIEKTRRLSDLEATAQYYNNLGVDALIEQNIALAFAYFQKALNLDRRLDYIWSNLGVIYRRNGQTGDAVLAYNTALQLNPSQQVALNNLYVIHTEDENLEAAEVYRVRVEKNRQKNPYYLQYLAEVAMEEKRYSEAISLAHRAIRIDEQEYRFHYTLAQSQYRAGKTEKALVSLEHAKTLAPDSEKRELLTLPGNVLEGPYVD